jgi:hypothetical protein
VGAVAVEKAGLPNYPVGSPMIRRLWWRVEKHCNFSLVEGIQLNP